MNLEFAKQTIEIATTPIIVRNELNEEQKSRQLKYIDMLSNPHSWKMHQVWQRLNSKSIIMTDVGQSSIQITLLYHSANFQVILMNVTYGRISTNISVINIDMESPLNDIKQLARGNFGIVYKCFENGRKAAIKSIYLNQHNFKEIFTEIVKQYIILLVASIFEIGPSMYNIFGFNLVIYRNSIEFSMQFCQKSSQSNQKPQESIDELKVKLRLFHSFSFVHLDIKPQNIAYSDIFQQFVFIDFGLSQFVRQGLGDRTMTKFRGSINYCSEQMLEIYIKSEQNYVDLYNNDAISLIKSLEYYKNKRQKLVDAQKSNSTMDQEKNLKIVWQSFLLIQIKYKLFLQIYEVGPIEQTDKFFEQNRTFIEQNQYKIFQYIKYLPLAQNLKTFITKYYRRLDQSQIKNIMHPSYRNYKSQYYWNQSVFCNRYNKIMTISKSKDTQTIKFIKQIKINGYIQLFSRKVQLCKQYLIKNHIQKIQLKERDIYRQALLYLFTSCNEKPFDAQTGVIIQNMIETLIILELISQEQLKRYYNYIIHLEIRFIDKITIIIQFLTSLQFIKYKVITQLDYDDLSLYFITCLDRYLTAIKNTIYEQFLIKQSNAYKTYVLIKYLITLKMNLADPQYQTIHLEQISLEQSELNSKILLLLHYTQLIIMKDKSEIIPTFNLKSIESFLKQQNHCINKQPTFTYLHLLIYEIYRQKRYEDQTKYIYHFFIKIFQGLQVQDFKIFFLSKLKMIEPTLNGDYIYIESIMDGNKEGQIQQLNRNLQSIKNIFDLIIKRCGNFHQYLYQILIIYNQIPYTSLKNLIIEIVKTNYQKIFKLSRKYHKIQFVHNNLIKRQISVICNLFLCIGQSYKQMQLFLQQFIDDSIMVIKSCQCFQCKIQGLLELKNIKFYLLMSENKTQEAIQHAIDILTFSFKHKQLNVYVKSMFKQIIRLMFPSQLKIQEGFGQIQFFYNYLNQTSTYQIILMDINTNVSMLEIFYIYAYKKQEQTDFILNMFKQISHQIIFSKIFYNAIFKMITIHKDNIIEFFPNFINDHLQIITNLLKLQCNHHVSSFISLYIYAFLQEFIQQSRIYFLVNRNKYLQKMVLYIYKSLSKISNVGKSIILNNYYIMFKECFDSPQKKEIWLDRLQIKQKQIANVNLLRNYTINSMSKQGRHFNLSKKWNLLNTNLKRYHNYSSGNINFKKW